MSIYSEKEKAKIVELFHKNNGKMPVVQIEWRRIHGKHAKVPDKNTIRKLVQRFSSSGSVKRLQYPENRRGSLSETISAEKLEEISVKFKNDPKLSIRKASQQLELPRSSLHKCLRTVLKLFPYKISVHQELEPQHMLQRVEFSSWLMNRIISDDSFFDRFWMKDEAHFHIIVMLTSKIATFGQGKLICSECESEGNKQPFTGRVK